MQWVVLSILVIGVVAHNYDVYAMAAMSPLSRHMLLQHISNVELKAVFYEVRDILRDKRVNYGIVDFYYQKNKYGLDSARLVDVLDNAYRMIDKISAFYEEVDMEMQRR